MKRAWLLLAAAGAWIIVCGVLFSATQHTGIITGIYWATASASTVGYGDITVHGTGGQILAIAVMLTAIPLLAAVFALITGGKIRAHIDRRLSDHHSAIHDRLDRIEGKDGQ